MVLRKTRNVAKLISVDGLRGDTRITNAYWITDKQGDLRLHLDFFSGDYITTSAVMNDYDADGAKGFITRSGSTYEVVYDAENELEADVIRSLETMYNLAKKLKETTIPVV